MPARARRSTGCALVLLGAAVLGGCGGDDDRADAGERPPTSIIVTASVAEGRINVSPRRFSAGPVRLIVSNQTGTAQAVTLATAGDAAGLTRTTPPIAASGTATLELDVTEGDYAVSTDDDGVASTPLRVGPPRPSAQNDLLLP